MSSCFLSMVWYFQVRDEMSVHVGAGTSVACSAETARKSQYCQAEQLTTYSFYESKQSIKSYTVADIVYSCRINFL